MRKKFKVWDNENNCWFEPTYRAYDGQVEDLYLNCNGDLIRRTISGLEHESLFPDRYEIFYY